MARRWPPPTYELTSEEGFPHERTFSIACTIGNTREIGGYLRIWFCRVQWQEWLSHSLLVVVVIKVLHHVKFSSREIPKVSHLPSLPFVLMGHKH